MAEARRCKAVRDYVGKTEDELTFQEGDVIYVPKMTPGEFLTGVFNGKVGKFPRVYVDDTTVEIKEKGKVTRVKAFVGYEAKKEEELSFPKGATMFVVARQSPEYWKGVYKGREGLIPSNCVQDASDTDTVRRMSGSKKTFEGARCQAVKSHVGNDKDELCFKAGEIVFVPKPDPTLIVWRGVSNNEVGTFPPDYVVNTKDLKPEEIEEMIKKNADDAEEKERVKKIDEIRAEKQRKLDEVAAATEAAGGGDAAPAAAVASEPAKAPEPAKEPEPEPEPAKEEEPAKEPEPEPAKVPEPEPAKEPEPAAAAPEPAAAEEPKPELSAKELKALKKKEEAERKKKEKEEAKRKKEEEKAAKKAAKAAKKK